MFGIRGRKVVASPQQPDANPGANGGSSSSNTGNGTAGPNPDTVARVPTQTTTAVTTPATTGTVSQSTTQSNGDAESTDNNRNRRIKRKKGEIFVLKFHQLLLKLAAGSRSLVCALLLHYNSRSLFVESIADILHIETI